MKIFVLLALSCGLAACATPAGTTDKEAYVDREYVTGSNIPRKGQAVTVDKQVLDQVSRNVPGTAGK